MRVNKFILLVALFPLLESCLSSRDKMTELTHDLDSSAESTNSLLQPWKPVYEGVPVFDQVKLEDLEEAMKVGIATHLSNIERITGNQSPASFENTIVALERSDTEIDKVFVYYGIWAANLSSPEFRNIQGRLAPVLSAYQSKISQNKKLFDRVKAVYESQELKNLSAEQQRLVEVVYNGFARNGALLEGKAAERFAAINAELAKLYVEFSNNILADEEGYILYLKEDELAGLPESFVASAANIAEANGKPGLYAITNTRSSMDPFLTFSTNRKLREKVWRNYYNRADNGDDNDNNKMIAQILKLRHERVQLLGYENYASWRLEDRMAQNPENALNLLLAVWPAAVKRVEEEVKAMQGIADKEGAKITIEPWDYRFYANKVRKAKYELDSQEVKQYLQLDKLTDAMFYVAERVFDMSFHPVAQGKVPVFHEDVRVWEVKRASTGEHIGLWYLDPYARPGKRSGAWATSYRSHSVVDGWNNVLSSNNSNFVKPAPGEALLISWDDATTFFHEFGHSLHSLSSQARYASLNGGLRDYTEFQSQLLERWLLTDEVIQNFFRHYKTDKPMPASLVAKIKKAQNFNQGFATTEYLASAIIDMKLHTVDPAKLDPDRFERETLQELGMPKELVMRHRTPHFGHVFSGEGYAAGYYGYLWAEVLTSDAAEAYSEVDEGFYNKDLNQKLVKFLFEPGNSIDPNDAYKLFRGRNPDPEALLRDRGFRDSVTH